MGDPDRIDQRLTSIESRLDNVELGLGEVNDRLENVANDAAAARFLAAAHDRDLADVGVKVDANRRAVNALGEQTTARFSRLETEMRAGFNGMRGRFDQVAAGHGQIVGLLTRVIPDEDGPVVRGAEARRMVIVVGVRPGTADVHLRTQTAITKANVYGSTPVVHERTSTVIRRSPGEAPAIVVVHTARSGPARRRYRGGGPAAGGWHCGCRAAARMRRRSRRS